MLQNSYDIDSDSDEEEENTQSNKEYPLVHDIQAVVPYFLCDSLMFILFHKF